MARNVEKAQSILNRYLAGKAGVDDRPKRRPHLASEVHDLNEADKWRSQILREIGKMVMEIQNEGLGEQKIRDLNDQINKLMRTKHHWERRILELGGPDYARAAPKITDSQGRVVAGGAGYRYFGAAKKLPGVRELFDGHDDEEKRAKAATRGELQRRVDADYYGYRDEDDGVLVKVEKIAEEKARAAATATAVVRNEYSDDGTTTAVAEKAHVAYVPLPSDKEIEARVVDSKKAKLLATYVTSELLQEQEEVKQMLARE